MGKKEERVFHDEKKAAAREAAEKKAEVDRFFEKEAAQKSEGANTARAEHDEKGSELKRKTAEATSHEKEWAKKASDEKATKAAARAKHNNDIRIQAATLAARDRDEKSRKERGMKKIRPEKERKLEDALAAKKTMEGRHAAMMKKVHGGR